MVLCLEHAGAVAGAHVLAAIPTEAFEQHCLRILEEDKPRNQRFKGGAIGYGSPVPISHRAPLHTRVAEPVRGWRSEASGAFSVAKADSE